MLNSPTLPQGAQTTPAVCGLGNKSSSRVSTVSPLIGTSTDNVVAAKEEFKSPRLRRRQLYIRLHRVIRGRGTRVGVLHLKCSALSVDSHVLIFQDSAEASLLSEAFPDKLIVTSSSKKHQWIETLKGTDPD